jgi:hypothetical protein
MHVTGSVTRRTGKPPPYNIVFSSPVGKRLQSVFVQRIAVEIQKCHVKIYLKIFRRDLRDATVVPVDSDETMMLKYFWRKESNSIKLQK